MKDPSKNAYCLYKYPANNLPDIFLSAYLSKRK